MELREAKSRRHSWILRQTTLTSDERPLYFFDFPPEVLFFPYGTMPRVTSPIFQTHDETHTLYHHHHQHHHHHHHHHQFYSRTIAYTKTRKRGRATILKTLVFNIRRSFEVLALFRSDTAEMYVYIYISSSLVRRIIAIVAKVRLSTPPLTRKKIRERKRGKSRASFVDRSGAGS